MMENLKNFESYYIEKCRVCESSNKYIDLLRNQTLLDNFESLVQQKVEQNDGLSQWLCKDCFHKIEEFIKFRRKCQETVQKYKCLLEVEVIQKLPTNFDYSHEKTNFDPLIETFHQKEETEIFLDNTETETIILDLKKEEYLDTFFQKIDNPELEPEVQIDEILEKPEDRFLDATQQNYQCQWCEKSYTKRSNLSRHVQSIHKNKRYSCDSCEKSFTQSTTLKEHKKAKHSSIDHLPYVDSKDVEEHIPENSQYSCDKCDKKFSNKNEMKLHVMSHMGIKMFPCKFCDKSYTHSNNLSRHVQGAHNNHRYFCDICKKFFTQKGSLREHKNNLHPDMDNTIQYQCPHCNKTLNTLKMYTQHMKRHETSEGKLKTSIKHQKFKSDQNSMVSKAPPRRYRRLCPYCGKFYKHLEEHIYLHTGEKIHECEFCQKKFTFKTTLTAHQRIHTGERPYNCTICNKTFRVSHHLKEHQNIHSDVKMFNCNICLKSFSSKLTLYKHSKIHNSPVNLVGSNSFVIPYNICTE